MIRASNLIYNKLIQNGVKDVFLYSGGAIMPLIDTFYNQEEIKYYISSNEHNGCNAAIGYAKSSQSTGVMITTSGPGLTNCVTSILDSQNDSSPLVVISGQVAKKSMGTQAFQECPATEITKPITKWSYVVDNAKEIGHVIDKAFYIANDKKKGAVHIDIPKCVLMSELQENESYTNVVSETDTFFFFDSYTRGIPSKRSRIKNGYLNEICRIINQTDKAVFFLGKGCNEYEDSIRELVYKTRIPVTTSMHAMGVFPENDELSVGMCGMHGSYAANMALQNADCIINIGARFDDRTTGNVSEYGRNATTIIQCNIEESELNKNVRVSHPIVCDAGTFANTLIDKVQTMNNDEWMECINSWKKEQPFQYHNDSILRVPDVLKSFDIYKNCHDICTFGVGNHLMMGCQYITWNMPKKIIASGSLGVMGCGIGYAIGAQIANPDKRVVLIDGDGSFNMTLTDLQTIKRYNLPIKIMIMNDSSLSMVRIWEKLFFDERYTATDNPSNPYYTELADSYSIYSTYCDNKDHLDIIMKHFLQYGGPALCEFKVRGEECFPLVAPGKALDDMILYSEDVRLNNTEVPN